MSSQRLISSINPFVVATVISAASLLGCGNANPSNTLAPLPANSQQEQSIKALKDKFYADHKCAIYQTINIFSCENGIVETICKDVSGNQQSDFYLQVPGDNAAWYSEADVDAEIADAQARLLAAQQKKAGFAAAKSPTMQCMPL